MTNDVITQVDESNDIAPRTYAELMEFARMVAESGLAPKDYINEPEKCAVAMQWGNELGLKPMQSLQNIAVIGNRPSLWGDAVLALVTASPACEDVIEFYENEGTEDMTAVCIAKRYGKADKSARFSIDDARTAGLVGKDVWQKYPKRMLQMRARGFALRDQFPDVLRGLPIAELVREAVDMGRVEEIDPTTGELKTAAPPPPRTPGESVKSKLRKVTLASVMKAIDDAQTADALKAAGEIASKLTNEDEKAKARQHYQAKLAAAKSKGKPPQDEQTGKKPAQAESVVVTYAEVASAIEAAERRIDSEGIAAAADLIQHVADEQQRKELTGLYEAAMHRLGDRQGDDEQGATA
ncbi:hypothetical protein AWB80_02856 [Caballeronia pedi]|uniref:RecT family protein n=1 Tax=Caballeronia pedi TaxID=1777141 RepID=A0A158AZW5_9BURK|nr:hypothetical protein [Caballeronia pedi]SAK63362.1 hypothetical protein AWB80_02856 [Caballeronia pedi]